MSFCFGQSHSANVNNKGRQTRGGARPPSALPEAPLYPQGLAYTTSPQSAMSSTVAKFDRPASLKGHASGIHNIPLNVMQSTFLHSANRKVQSW